MTVAGCGDVIPNIKSGSVIRKMNLENVLQAPSFKDSMLLEKVMHKK